MRQADTVRIAESPRYALMAQPGPALSTMDACIHVANRSRAAIVHGTPALRILLLTALGSHHSVVDGRT